MKKEEGLIDQILSIDHSLSEIKQKEIVRNILLKILGNLKGEELAPYLSECVYEPDDRCVKVVLRFPDGMHVPNSF